MTTHTPDAFPEKVAEYNDTYLHCRDMGHHWQSSTAHRTDNGCILRILTCTTCGTNRRQLITGDGYLTSTHYTYKTGYLIPGTGRLTADHRATLRLESITRQL
jgi:hypothetical protein